MTLRIVTDSTCDLPPHLIAELGITVIPLFINVGSQGYRDGIDMTREAFYTGLPTFRPHPTTAAPGAEAFQEVYERLAAQGATAILSIHIAEALSATVNVARIAARETTALPVTVLDSGQLTLGLGFMAQMAAQAAAAGAPLAEISALLEDQSRRTHVIAALDTLEYLRRSGRMNGVVAGLGSLLQIKPILKMHRGQPTSERVRTRAAAQQRLLALLAEIGELERAALVHTHSPQTAEALRGQGLSLLPAGDIPSVDITPVLGAHLGPNAAGFAVVSR